ncbi:MAG: hypothetical protein R3Y24_12820 [Eubacteriales bacterium]
MKNSIVKIVIEIKKGSWYNRGRNRYLKESDFIINEERLRDEEGDVMERTYLEVNLPDFLKDSIDELVKCREQNLTIREDCHYMDTQSSINIAFVENLIDETQANYLRDKYLYQKLPVYYK